MDTAGRDALDDTMEERLYGLIEIVERQQATTRTELDELAADRHARAADHAAWLRGIAGVRDDLCTAVAASVAGTAAGVAAEGTAAIREAVTPLFDTFADVAEQTERAEAGLSALARWITWRFIWWGLGACAGLLVMSWLASSAILWWDSGAIGRAQARKAQLQAEVAELEANADAWTKSGMIGRIDRCGPKKRLCVRTDDSAGVFGQQGDYRVVRGY